MKAKKDIKKKAVKKVDEPAIKSPNLFPVVGIGASAGGLDAFKKLLKAIPEDSGMAYVLVQHLDPKHESLLPELLQKVTKIPVLEITDDIKVHPDHIYVIPSNKMMVATDGVLLLAPRPEKSTTGRNLPIDLFFTSLAEVHQEHAIGVVLSGTASDGTQGLKAIKDHGGITFAQDEASAEYDGMPHSAAQAGVVDFILPPGEIPKKLLEIINKTILSDEELQNIPRQEEDVFKQILSLLRIRKGVDFTYYKQTTIRRRILRRMVVNKNEETGDYLKFLRGNNPEQDMLYQDMLIPVTSFFRDKKVFDNLCHTVFHVIIKNKIPGEITRIWVAGCSTGQEVFSFAICFKEFLGENHERIQIFGTDLSEPAITKARTGLYEKSEIDGISPERLKEYFTKSNGGYQINKSIRDMCVFAHHNFLKDPPFGKMDCISCRNVLIYMEPYLQKKALTTFHYALNPKGFLLLGKSETTGGVPDLFAAVEKTDKLYTRKDVPGRFMQVASLRSEQILNRSADSLKSEPGRTDFQKTADDILLTKYTPAGVVVNETMDIVHFRGNTAKYLEQSPGKPSHNLLMMAKSGLGFELRNILHKAKTDKVSVVKENIPLIENGSIRNISIEAVPLPNTAEPYYLVLFHDNILTDTDGPETGNRKKVSAKTKKDEKDIQIKLLEQELAQAREDMRSITEDQEASNEELQSANEELLSGSEELQSLNEELETSKEELQSTNEELTVLNFELNSLNEQVTDARNYSESIVATLYQPLLVLDKNLRVKTANKAFYKTFQVNEQETEGVLIYDLGNRQWNIPKLRKLLEEILPEKKQITDFEVTHNFLSIGERVILLSALEITREKIEEKLILLSIEDITEKATARKIIEASEKRFSMMFMQSPFAFAVFKGKDMVIEIANDSVKEILGKGKDIENKPLLKVLPEITNGPLPELLNNVYTTGIPYYGYEMLVPIHRKGKLEDVYFNFVYQPYLEADETISGVACIAYEVTNEVSLQKKIEESEKQFRMMAELMPQKVWTSDAEGNKDYFNKTLLDYAGLTTEELIGTGWEKIIHPDDREKDKIQWEECISTGKHYEAENRLLRKDGKYLWHLTLAVPLKDDAGKIKMWVGSKTEIQEQRQLKDELKRSVEKRTAELLEANKELLQKNKEVEEAREKLMSEYSRSLIEASLDPLVTINMNGKITDMNQATVNITGITKDGLTSSNYFDYFTEPQKAREIFQQVFVKGSVTNSPLTIRHVDGKLTDVFLNGSVYKDAKDNVAGVVIVARDVTEEKRISTELTEAIIFAEMATVIAEEAKGKAQHATQVAEDAVKSKQQFLSNMSHEIRTPMNAIIGFTKVLFKTELTAKQKEYLTAVKMSGDALIVLINDILDLAKVDAGKMTFEQVAFKMSLSISTMVHMFEPKIHEKNLKLVKEYDSRIPEVLIGDPIRLHQIILNLISNAVKFTSKGKITVSVQLLEEDEETVAIKFSVADTGIGIPEERMEEIFENFQQASSETSRLYGGTGLGLSIVKQLVEPQGGKILVKSKVNEGSVFSFILKFKKTKAEGDWQTETYDPYTSLDNEMIKNIKVLVVEDIALNQLLMKTLLDDFGFEQDVASNGKIAIELLTQKNSNGDTNEYDIILMDLQMPEMNGFETTEYIRNTLQLQIPIIALTADVTTVDLSKCIAVGMNDYIAKPVDERLLYSKIVGLTMNQGFSKKKKAQKINQKPIENRRCIDLTYLNKRTKSDPKLMMEMISLYLEQTPSLIQTMKKSFEHKDWISLYASVHKMIPSFSIMGISLDIENMAKKVQEYASNQQDAVGIPEMVLKLESVCLQACHELETELKAIKKQTHEKRN
ncbi:MAG: chemotaxis protein CheB [Chitinophagaceae bacterium]